MAESSGVDSVTADSKDVVVVLDRHTDKRLEQEVESRDEPRPEGLEKVFVDDSDSGANATDMASLIDVKVTVVDVDKVKTDGGASEAEPGDKNLKVIDIPRSANSEEELELAVTRIADVRVIKPEGNANSKVVADIERDAAKGNDDAEKAIDDLSGKMKAIQIKVDKDEACQSGPDSTSDAVSKKGNIDSGVSTEKKDSPTEDDIMDNVFDNDHAKTITNEKELHGLVSNGEFL